MAQIESIRKHIKGKPLTRYIGIALMIAFVLVTAMFIVLYVNSEQRQNHESNGVYSNGESMGIGSGGEYDGLQGSSIDQLAQDPADPGDPTGGQPSEYPYDNGDAQGDSEQTEQAEPIGVAYLTFDDGPDRAVTPGILDILLEENIKATFFVLPYQGVDDLYQRIIDEGHEIGNHSFSHVYERLYERNVSNFRSDIQRARNFIYDNFEYTTTSFRFPGGHHTAGNGLRARLDVLRDLGYRHFHWHVDPDDWRVGRTAEEVRESVREQTSNHVRNGREHVIILMHDRYQRTLEALPGIISDLREMGFEFDIVRNMPR